MPRYIYRCDSCSGHFQIRHGMSEEQEECIICMEKGNLVRVPQIPSLVTHKEEDSKVGDTTKNFIEQNRELLNTMKKEARSVVYED